MPFQLLDFEAESSHGFSELIEFLFTIVHITAITIVTCWILNLRISNKTPLQFQEQFKEDQAIAQLLKGIGDATETRIQFDKIVAKASDLRAHLTSMVADMEEMREALYNSLEVFVGAVKRKLEQADLRDGDGCECAKRDTGEVSKQKQQ